MKNIILVLLVILKSTNVLFAQVDTTTQKNYFFLFPNVGIGYSPSDRLVVDGGINIGYKNAYLLVGLNQSVAYFDFHPSDGRLEKLKSCFVVGGINCMQNRNFIFIVYGGMSFGQGVYRSNGFSPLTYQSWFGYYTEWKYKYENFNYSGIPLILKLVYTPSNWDRSIPHSILPSVLHFSLDLYCNLHYHSDFGLVLNLNIGKLK